MKKEIRLGDHLIGTEHPPFLIAEMSGNHNQSLDRAMEIVEAAAASGAHALKLQTYTADTMTLNLKTKEFVVSEMNELWNGRTLHSLYQEAYTPWEWHKPIFERCKQLGMLCFSTPFDETSVDFLNELGVPCFKIASFENTFIPLIKKAAALKKPIIMSTGMASVAELEESVREIKKMGCEDLILLKCTSTYPASPKNINLKTIPHMRELFDVQVGLSDHTMGCGVAVASVALGATIIEKHFTLRRADGGVDAAFSMEPAEFKQMKEETHKAWESMGKVNYGAVAEESKSRTYRRSIYISRNLEKGEVLTKDNTKCVRPAHGLETKYYEYILGKKVNKKMPAGTPLKLEYIDSVD